ncbi:60S ribosomal protein L7 [Entamoeba marina]
MSVKVPTAVQRKECKETTSPCNKEQIATFRKDILQRSIKHHNEYVASKKAVVAAKKEAKINGDLYAEAEPKLIVAVRIRGINGVSPKIRKIMKLFRLRQIYNAVFIKANASTLKMLRLIEPYIAYGYPNLKTISDMIYKRGALKINGQRIPITSNCLISKQLGCKDVVCVEDIIHEIYTTGKNFKTVSNTLWPFKLNPPRSCFARKNKKVHFMLGGAFGNREKMINKLLESMI